MKSYITESAAATEALGEALGKLLKGGECIAFSGSLGAGKTCFTRGVARGMGIDCHVSSPTFAIVNDYGGSPCLVHFDMYKISSWEELYSCGFFDYLDAGAVVAVEWSENIENALPDRSIRVDIRKGEGDNQRIIRIEGPDL